MRARQRTPTWSGRCSTPRPPSRASPVHVPVAHGDTTLDVVVDGEGFLESVAERFYAGADGIDAIPAFIQQAAGR